MLKPSTNTVKAIVRIVRKRKIITLDQLREKLASDFSVQASCPASTIKALQILSKEAKLIGYWRVVKKKNQ